MNIRFALSFALVSAAACSTPQVSVQGLELEARLLGGPKPPEEVQVLRATLRNRGTTRLEVYLPEHHGLVPFPSWELRDEHGAVVRPEAPSFQSMWVTGLQGEVLELAPGAEANFDSKVTLSPGNWTATCTLAQERAEVPWGMEAFRKELRPWPTLWTGSVRSQAVQFRVQGFTTPQLTLRVPEAFTPGTPCLAECDLLWPTEAGAVPPRVALQVEVGTKAYGSGTARWIWNGDRWSPAEPGEFGALPATMGSRWNTAIDLAACSYRTARAGDESLELAELVDQGWFYSSIVGVDDTGRVLFRGQCDCHLARLSASAPPGLELLVRPSARGPRHVDVILRNIGSTPQRVPERLDYPRHVAFALRFPGDSQGVHWSVTHDAAQGGLELRSDDPPSEASLPKSLSWSGAAFEREARANARTVLLAPGNELTRTVDLSSLITGPTSQLDEPLAVRALWRQRARGVALGLEPALTLGALTSAELELPRVTR